MPKLILHKKSNTKKPFDGGWHSTEVAFSLLTQFLNSAQLSSIVLLRVSSRQRLNHVDQTNLVVQQKEAIKTLIRKKFNTPQNDFANFFSWYNKISSDFNIFVPNFIFRSQPNRRRRWIYFTTFTFPRSIQSFLFQNVPNQVPSRALVPNGNIHWPLLRLCSTWWMELGSTKW